MNNCSSSNAEKKKKKRAFAEDSEKSFNCLESATYFTVRRENFIYYSAELWSKETGPERTVN